MPEINLVLLLLWESSKGGGKDNMKRGISCYFTLYGILLHSIPFYQDPEVSKWCQTVMKTDAHSGNKASSKKRLLGNSVC